MRNYFDFHTHAFVDRLAERAMSSLSATSGITPTTNGTVTGLKNIMKMRGISGALLLPIATKPSQQHTINNWAADIMGDGLLCCGTIHPDAEDALSEIDRIKQLGLCGVKFHSEYQDFAPHEERMCPIYEGIAANDLIAVFHGGLDPYTKGEILATPERFAAVGKAFPEMKIVAAHLGGMTLWDDVERHLAGKFRNIWLDVSVIAGHIEPEQLLRIIRSHGTDRILFGSDCPWDDPANEITMIEELPLSETDKELIFSKNAKELLEIDRQSES